MKYLKDRDNKNTIFPDIDYKDLWTSIDQKQTMREAIDMDHTRADDGDAPGYDESDEVVSYVTGNNGETVPTLE